MVVTLLGVGRGGCVLLLQDVGVDGVEVGTKPVWGGAGQRHHANLNRRLNMADTSGKGPAVAVLLLNGTGALSFYKSCLVWLKLEDWLAAMQRGSGLSVEATSCCWLGSQPKNGVLNSGVTSLEDCVRRIIRSGW